MNKNLATYVLNDGNAIPAIGFGSYKADGTEGSEAVKNALKCGYRLIDTAEMYGNEAEIGRAIQSSGVSREDIFITTKLWRDHLGAKHVRPHFLNSIKKLGLDYLDLYLIHWPCTESKSPKWQQINAETWLEFEKLQQEGLVRSIGVSNFLPHHLEPLLQNCSVKPAVNQIEFHPGYLQQEIYEKCRQEDILVQAWSPLARGKILNNEVLIAIAENYHKTVSQVALRWITEKGCVPIPKSNNLSRMAENLDVFDFKLSPSEMLAIDQMEAIGFSGYHPDRI